jgi:DNA invertase Pin-like site-specific DNA recombinase
MVQAVAYARISRDREGLELGVRRQLEDCRALAARRGWSIVAEELDDDISATSGKRRPGWERTLQRLESGQADALLAYSSSRCYRLPRDLEPLLDLAKTRGVQIATVASGDVDLSTADGRMLAGILVSVDRGEAERISERIRRKLLELARNGADKGGPRPFGYEDDRMTVRESEAELVRQAAGDVLKGTSLNAIARRWNEDRVETPTGRIGSWTGVRVRQILTSPRVAGLRQHGGRGKVLLDDAGEPVRTLWPAILDEDVWLQLRSRFGTGNGRTHSKGRKHLLTGLVLCDRDGERMEARPAWRNQPRAYVCRGCNRRIGADSLEEYVIRDQMRGAILAAYDRQPTPGAVADLEALKRRHTEVTESLSELARDRYVKRTLPADMFDKMSGELTREVQSLESALQPKAMPKASGSVWDYIIGPGYESFEAASESWTVQERHDALAEIIEEIRIGPGVAGRRGLSPERVELIFKPPFDEE